MKRVFLFCFHVLRKSLYPLQDIVQNQRCTNILIKCQVAPRVLVKVEKTCAERNGDVTHFVCLGYTLHYKCWEKALVVKAYLGWYIYIHLIFFHRKLFSKKLQLLPFEEVEWLKELNEEKNQWPRRTEIRIKN